MTTQTRFTPQDVMDVFHERHDALHKAYRQYAPALVNFLSILGFAPEQEQVIRDQYERGDFARYFNVGLH